MKDATDRVFVLKVALKGRKRIWRKIAIRGDQTLAILHDAIFAAFDRYDEHLYSYFFSSRPTSGSRTRLRGARQYGCPHSETDGKAESTRLDSLRLRPRDCFEYLFDYGDEWWHEITVVDLQAPAADLTYPSVIQTNGESPPQYDDSE